MQNCLWQTDLGIKKIRSFEYNQDLEKNRLCLLYENHWLEESVFNRSNCFDGLKRVYDTILLFSSSFRIFLDSNIDNELERMYNAIVDFNQWRYIL